MTIVWTPHVQHIYLYTCIHIHVYIMLIMFITYIFIHLNYKACFSSKTFCPRSPEKIPFTHLTYKNGPKMARNIISSFHQNRKRLRSANCDPIFLKLRYPWLFICLDQYTHSSCEHKIASEREIFRTVKLLLIHIPDLTLLDDCKEF